MTYFDTHALVWLYLGDRHRLTPNATAALADTDLLASPMVVVELEILHEIRRLNSPAKKVLDALRSEIGLRVCDLPFAVIAEHASELKWTRDPFDRLIVANARAADAALVTKDERILKHYPKAVW